MRRIFIFQLLLVLTGAVYAQQSESYYTDTRDQRNYKTIQVGNQVWFAENFAYLPFVDTVSVSIYDYKGKNVAEAKKQDSYMRYGALYNWEMARKLAPEGWRLPTDADWQQLEKTLGIPPEQANTIGWRGAGNEAHLLKENGGSGFRVMFGGWRADYGEFKFKDQHANFWCADSYDEGRAFERMIGVRNGKIGRDYGNKGCGFSVRYVRDMPVETAVTYPEKEWDYLQQAKTYGWNTQKLDLLNNFVRDSTNATGIVVVQSGKILFDYGNTAELSYIASCRKSILSVLYGKYVANKTIDLTKTLADLQIDDIGGLLPSEKQATVLDLLKSKSGVFHAASNEGGNEFLFPERGTKKPNSFFVYNNWDFNAAGHVFEQLTGKSIYQSFEQDIAKPIGFEDWDIAQQFKSGDTTKSKFKAYHFMFSTRDMARFGYLLLRNGKWKNEQVVPQNWVQQMTSITTGLAEMKTVDPRIKNWPWYKWGYGLMWRIWDSPDQLPELTKAYTATGNMGQYITIIPSMDLVIALKTKPDYGRRTEYDVYDRFLYKVIDAKK